MKERTLGIIKPDAVKKGLIGEILSIYEKAGFKIIAMKLLRLTKEQAEGFYYVHRGKKFFNSLTDFMSSGPCVVFVLEAENAIQRNRELMGATDPSKAKKGTIRYKYGTKIERNAVHGSDSPESAKFEISYFFNAMEIVPSKK